MSGGPYNGARGHFLRTADGEIAWLRLGGRLYRRVSGAGKLSLL